MTDFEIVPISFKEAKEFVQAHHRHHRPPQGHKFSIGLRGAEGLVGVVMAGRPVSRHQDDGVTLEVTRLATDGAENACSALYGAAWRAARGLGYRRMITYTRADESGTSPKAAGLVQMARRKALPGWSRPSRTRPAEYDSCERILWEIRTSRYAEKCDA